VTTAILIRVGHALFSVLALLVLVFTMLRLTGDPINFLLDPDASPEQRAFARQELGLDQPVPVQFAIYVGNVIQGDLGISFRSRVPVADLIAQRVPATLTMAGAAILLTIVIGVPLGIYSAYRRGTVMDRSARFVAALGQSVPQFWLGFLLILVFAVYIPIFPAGGYGGIENLILPTITLSFAAIAGLTRLLRSSMVEEMGSDYINFHRMKGLSEHVILWKHALRNAGLTTLSFLGILVAGLVTGSVLVETIFVWPGLGRLMIESIGFRDFNVVQGVMIVFSLAYIGVNLAVDLLYTVLNPRLR
jgi:peptide/nickel transport system permease protein